MDAQRQSPVGGSSARHREPQTEIGEPRSQQSPRFGDRAGADEVSFDGVSPDLSVAAGEAQRGCGC